MAKRILEIAANSLASALAARDGGADRIELCASLAEGGMTPSYGALATTRDALRIPIYVLIRPRAGDFLYGSSERDEMLRDIEASARLGCEGVVIGALDADGDIDINLCRDLIAAAGKLGVTFHRAFDIARDQHAALETIISLGCERVLTSGASASAQEGSASIAALVAQAGGRIRIMAGGGVRAEHLREIVAKTAAHEFHASAGMPRVSAMRHRNPGLRGLDANWTQSDVEQVRRLRAALDATEGDRR
jgi:copper homeostasis protein